MNRGLKAIGIILSLLLLSVLVAVVFFTSPSVAIPFGYNHSQFFFNALANNIFQQYLFWIAAIFAIALVIFILFLIFYPKTKQTFVLKEDQGRVSLDKKAIEGFVRSKLNQADFSGKPKVKVKATNRKINVNVAGELTRTSSLLGKTETLMEEIRRELQTILGTDEKVKVNVAYKEYEPDDDDNKQSRVE